MCVYPHIRRHVPRKPSTHDSANQASMNNTSSCNTKTTSNSTEPYRSNSMTMKHIRQRYSHPPSPRRLPTGCRHALPGIDEARINVCATLLQGGTVRTSTMGNGSCESANKSLAKGWGKGEILKSSERRCTWKVWGGRLTEEWGSDKATAHNVRAARICGDEREGEIGCCLWRAPVVHGAVRGVLIDAEILDQDTHYTLSI
jgi:hypothetical protein